MPKLDQLFERRGLKPYAEPQCFDATVVELTAAGPLVVCPSFDAHLRWGPCKPAGAGVVVGQDVAVLISEAGTVWLVGIF